METKKLTRRQKREQAKEVIVQENLKKSIGFEIARLLNDTSTGLSSEKSDKSVTVILHNKTDEDHDISLFNHVNWFKQISFPEGVKVSVGSSNYDEMMIHSIQTPFMACGLKLKVDDVDQFDTEIHGMKNTFYGTGSKDKTSLNAYSSMYQNMLNFIDMPEVSFIKTIDTSLDFKLYAGKKFKITFFLYSLIDFSKLLKLAGHQNYISGLPNINQTISIDRHSGAFINMSDPNRKNIWKSIGRIFKSLFPSKKKDMDVRAQFQPRNNFEELPKWTERLDITITAKVDFFARVVVLKKGGSGDPIYEAEMAIRNNSYSWNESTHVDTTKWENGLYVLKVYDGKKLKATVPLLRHFDPPKPEVLVVPDPTNETLFHQSDGTLGNAMATEAIERTDSIDSDTDEKKEEIVENNADQTIQSVEKNESETPQEEVITDTLPVIVGDDGANGSSVDLEEKKEDVVDTPPEDNNNPPPPASTTDKGVCN